MFDEFREGAPLKAVYWKDLRPGLVFAGGLSISGGPPPELLGHPVLDGSLLRALHERYKLNPDKKVLVLAPESGGDGGLSPRELSEALRKAEARLAPLNGLRREIGKLKGRQPQSELPIWESAWVEKGSLIWPLRGSVPTLLADLTRDIGLASVLNREVFTRFRLPADKPVAIHLAVDLSYSMEASGKDAVARGAAELFRVQLKQTLPLADVLVYAFSDECRVVEGPLSDRALRRGGTNYAAFAAAALRRQRPDRPNALILFTDGLPDKVAEARAGLAKLAEAGFFYTQIVFNLSSDRKSFVETEGEDSLDGYYKGEEPSPSAREMSAEEYAEQEAAFRLGFQELARSASGYQIVIDADEALGLASIEVFDRWYGGLSN